MALLEEYGAGPDELLGYGIALELLGYGYPPVGYALSLELGYG
jgi:hypothetical protein